MAVVYKYKGISGSQYISGTVEGINRDEAAFKLKEKGYIITELTKVSGKELEEKKGKNKVAKEQVNLTKKKVPVDQIIIFTKQLETMVRAGLPILKTLNMLVEQTTDPVLKAIVQDIVKQVESGSQLSDSFATFPNVFDNIYVNLLRAGESSGKIDLFLKKLCISMDKSQKIRASIRGALIYPSVLFVVAVSVIAVMMVFVVPVFQEMFKGAPGGLPASTQMIITISEFLRDPMGGGVAAIVIVALVMLFSYIMKTSFKVRRFFHYKFLKVKLFGELIRKSSLAKIAMIQGHLTAAGVPVMESLDIAATSVSNIAIQEAMNEVKRGVYGGEPLSELFAKAPDIFDPTFSGMVAVGENTGNMEEMLESISMYYEEQMDETIQKLTALLEPVMIVFMGATIGFILVAMYTPMFKMGGTL